jgi:hypothetical protein
MSPINNKSFFEEIQEKYTMSGMKYVPSNYAEAGLVMKMDIDSKDKRPHCPVCDKIPIIHGYIKNG